jgi:hypothetical protein
MLTALSSTVTVETKSYTDIRRHILEDNSHFGITFVQRITI